MLYPKIYSPFQRHHEGPLRNKLDLGAWLRPEFELLKDLRWEWTEKVNGTNVRVIWDGHKVRFGGRTDGAQMPIKLLDALNELFPEELLENQFGSNPAVLYGEGFGPGIQNGGNYRSDMGFVLFDVMVPDTSGNTDLGYWWLRRENIVDVAGGLGIGVVPVFFHDTIQDAIDYVTHRITSNWGDFPAEGLVGKPPLGILGRDGDRLMVKIKAKDFKN